MASVVYPSIVSTLPGRPYRPTLFVCIGVPTNPNPCFKQPRRWGLLKQWRYDHSLFDISAVLIDFSCDAVWIFVANNSLFVHAIVDSLNKIYWLGSCFLWKLFRPTPVSPKCEVLSFTRNVTTIVFKYDLNGTVLKNISCYNWHGSHSWQGFSIQQSWF